MITDLELAAIRDRLVAATPGPLAADGIRIVDANCHVRVIGYADRRHDADLFAHAPTDLVALCDAVDELRAALARWRSPPIPPVIHILEPIPPTPGDDHIYPLKSLGYYDHGPDDPRARVVAQDVYVHVFDRVDSSVFRTIAFIGDCVVDDWRRVHGYLAGTVVPIGDTKIPVRARDDVS